MMHRVHLQQAPHRLDIVFAAAKDPTRRGLSDGERTQLMETMLPGHAIVRRPSGQPVAHSADGLYVSLSHAVGVTALAVAPFPVGIDIEAIDPTFDIAQIDAELFGPHDFACLQHQSKDAQTAHFYRLWTLKEARLKRDGLSLAHAALPEIVSTYDGPTELALDGPAGLDMSSTWLTAAGKRYCVGACWALRPDQSYAAATPSGAFASANCP